MRRSPEPGSRTVPADEAAVAKTLPWLGLFVPLTALTWYVTEERGPLHSDLYMLVTAIALVGGVTILLRRRRRPNLRTLPWVLGGGSVLLAGWIYATGTEGEGLQELYLVVIPAAYLVLSRRQAVVQTLVMAMSYGVALLAEELTTSRVQTREFVSAWLLTLLGVVMVGTTARMLRCALRERDRVYRRAYERTDIGMVRSSVDGTRLEANPAFCRMLGRSATEIVGSFHHDFTHPDDIRVSDWVVSEAAAGRDGWIEKRYLRPDGRVVWTACSLTALQAEDGEPAQYVSHIVDITERREAEHALQRRADAEEAIAELGRLALQSPTTDRVMPVAVELVQRELEAARVAILRIEEEDDCLRIVASSGWNEGAQVASTQTFAAAVAASERAILVGELQGQFPRSTLLHDAGMHSGAGAPIRQPGGVWGVLVAHHPDRDHFGSEHLHYLRLTANVMSAALQRAHDEEDARFRTYHDELTGLPNRLLYIDRLQQALARSARTGGRVAALAVDIDHFRLVNDTLGHGSGDAVLIAMAERFRNEMRAGDTIARLGADEFVSVVEADPDGSQAAQLASRLVDQASAPFVIDGEEIFVTVTVGITLSSPDSRAENMLREADAAMAGARERGHGPIGFYDVSMSRRAQRRLRVRTGLSRAIDAGELELHYQPVVHAISRQVARVEALVRWRHPTQGLLSPASFIDVAEDSGLIVGLGRWVLTRACADAMAWPTGIGVNVNVAARQLTDPGFLADLRGALADSGLDPTRLAIEITESALMASQEPIDTIAAVKATGVRISLDDFGTGYSSLSYLRRLPLDGVKIDRSFVTGMGDGLADEGIVRAVLGLARTLGLSVVAEGVETRQQAHALRSLGCGYLQGYLLGEPVPADQIALRLGAPQHPASPANGRVRLHAAGHPSARR